jgi:hypothetical protein
VAYFIVSGVHVRGGGGDRTVLGAVENDQGGGPFIG